ncbi:hypothetical protein [Arsenophonus endosymbiont of Aleurodicus floccissimus]|uniref:hypothetical protein n=1 Tax=Arsenophonus endosymbiont of Aleurodicus floccissimus TaxID=2152761 RepID=UPI001EDF2355|nr:hypothetical protein [Arsenophonus endosymbiont of Aleurodicus floccissimus]
MSIVREYLYKHDIQIEGIPHQGIRLIGNEWAIRTCITEILWRRFSQKINKDIAKFSLTYLDNINLTYINKVLKNSLSRFDIRLTNEGHQYPIFNCATTILGITHGRELTTFINNEMDPVIQNTVKEISNGLIYFLVVNYQTQNKLTYVRSFQHNVLLVTNSPIKKRAYIPNYLLIFCNI